MSDHYHHVSEVQGAAEDPHSHSPRDIGAADEHDLTSLQRDVQTAQFAIGRLERLNEEKENRIRDLDGRVQYWADANVQLQSQVVQLSELVEKLTAAVAQLVNTGRL